MQIPALRKFAGALAVSLCLVSGCAQLPTRPTVPTQAALAAGEGTKLDNLFAPVETSHPGSSGFRLVQDGLEAFALRAQSARLAGRSIDLQTYIWHSDTTGRFIARRLLEAADRGVKVRVLVDDMDARDKNAGFAALAAHPNIEVRMFNPFASRSGKLAFASEGLRSFKRINHRMHNKSWIVDNRVAFAGGRNIGDEYFGASDEVNFVDLDFAMIGPVVRDASASFDRYWNSEAAWPMQLLDPKSVNATALEKLRQRLAKAGEEPEAEKYREALRSNESVRALFRGEWSMRWAPHYQFISDDPLKATMREDDPQRSRVALAMAAATRAAGSAVDVISPYFVPGEEGTKVLVDSATAGRKVRVLTNSLAANDVAAVHGGYSRYRKRLLAGGVKIWELKPRGDGKADKSSFKGSSGASLHTKAYSVDSQTVFVGSYNLDPRSTQLNCEQSVMVEDADLAQELGAIFDKQASGERAWHVTLEDKKLHWSDGVENFTDDPKAGIGARFQAWFARTFHLDSQL